MKPALASTLRVVNEVVEERRRQDAKWGEQNHPSLSPEVPREIPEDTAADMGVPSANTARQRVENLARRGMLGYADIALEEFCEAIEAAAEVPEAPDEDESFLRVELVQTAAVLVAWIESIDRRTAKRAEARAKELMKRGVEDPGSQQ